MAPHHGFLRGWSSRLLCYSPRRTLSSLLQSSPSVTNLLKQNLIYALEASLKSITEGSPNLEERFAIHKSASALFKSEALKLGFTQVPNNPAHAANGMTALYVPEDMTPAAIIGALGARNIVIAGGLHKDIKTR